MSSDCQGWTQRLVVDLYGTPAAAGISLSSMLKYAPERNRTVLSKLRFC